MESASWGGERGLGRKGLGEIYGTPYSTSCNNLLPVVAYAVRLSAIIYPTLTFALDGRVDLSHRTVQTCLFFSARVGRASD